MKPSDTRLIALLQDLSKYLRDDNQLVANILWDISSSMISNKLADLELVTRTFTLTGTPQ